jgi:hypothetical protein
MGGRKALEIQTTGFKMDLELEPIMDEADEIEDAHMKALRHYEGED